MSRAGGLRRFSSRASRPQQTGARPPQQTATGFLTAYAQPDGRVVRPVISVLRLRRLGERLSSPVRMSRLPSVDVLRIGRLAVGLDRRPTH
jgi:hypothetical protein